MAASIVFLGDDFTGASDSLATYARAGLNARMVFGRTVGASQELDVLGLPTDLRSLPPERAQKDVAFLWPQIAAENPNVLHLKVCSTFDSAPHVGSIGAVAQVLIARYRPDVVAVIGGQPSLGRYCAFGTLFARGPDGATHRIDRHPVMRSHPVTPLHEADLRLLLAAQGLTDLALVSFSELDNPQAVADRLRAGPALLDVTHPSDLTHIAEALRLAGGRQLLIGASSVAEILGAATCEVRPGPLPPAPKSRNLLLFAGSRSATTAAQVAAAEAYTRLALPPDGLHAGSLVALTAELLNAGKPTLVHLLPDANYALSPEALADLCADFVADVLTRTDVGYIGLAGGDTSSRICGRLGFEALVFERALGPGVCICTASHPEAGRDHMRVMLKGGQMGGPDLFDQFAAICS